MSPWFEILEAEMNFGIFHLNLNGYIGFLKKTEILIIILHFY